MHHTGDEGELLCARKVRIDLTTPLPFAMKAGEKLAASAKEAGAPEPSEEEKQQQQEEKAAKAMGNNSGAFMVGSGVCAAA
jgi:hypothetical protein